MSWSTDSTSRTISLTITQAARFGSFEFPLRLALTDSSGTTRRVEFAVPAVPETKLQLPISDDVATVEVDPEGQLLARVTVRQE